MVLHDKMLQCNKKICGYMLHPVAAWIKIAPIAFATIKIITKNHHWHKSLG